VTRWQPLCELADTQTFKRQLKTSLFQQAYGSHLQISQSPCAVSVYTVLTLTLNNIMYSTEMVHLTPEMRTLASSPEWMC